MGWCSLLPHWNSFLWEPGSIGTGSSEMSQSVMSVSCLCPVPVAVALQHQECPSVTPRLPAIWTSEFRAGHLRPQSHIFVVSLPVTCCISIFHFLLDPVSLW